jgi:hypothetical protein
MSTPNTFRSLIALWPTVAEFSKDIDIPYQTASAMARRDSIDADYWPRVIDKAAERGFENITWELLAKMAAGVAEQTQQGAA